MAKRRKEKRPAEPWWKKRERGAWAGIPQREVRTLKATACRCPSCRGRDIVPRTAGTALYYCQGCGALLRMDVELQFHCVGKSRSRKEPPHD